jgi:hypothetical protein
MKTLDDYIRKNPELFDTDEPEAGHIERFHSRLQRESRRHTVSILFKIAAVILLAFVIGYTVMQEHRQLSRGLNKVFAGAESSELKEAEQFYMVQLDLYYTKLEKLPFRNDGEQKRQILNELSFMDKEVRNMKRDLRQNPGDERIENAIINYYQVKLELMDMVITRTQNVNSTIL